ncbi:hypothetical protein ACOMHN_046744 [Nucella lapillus]
MDAQLVFFLLSLTFIPLFSCTILTIRPNQRLTLTPISTVTFNQQEESSVGRCIFLCRSTSTCVSVNAQWSNVTSTLTCELLSKYLHETPSSLASTQGWSFIQEDPAYTDSSWALAFRVTTGVQKNVWDAIHADGRHDDAYEMQGCVRPGSALPCQSHFRSYLMDRWTKIKQVRLRVYKAGSVVVEMTFNGQDSTRLTWLAKFRVLTSTWTDITTRSHNYFSIEGIPSVYRRFYLSSYHHGCPLDLGWLVVSDNHTHASIPSQCTWEKRKFPLPVIYYCPQSTVCNWQNTYDTADFMTIHVMFST